MAPTTLTWIDPRTLDEAGKAELWRFVSRFEELSFEECARRLGELTSALVGRYASGAIGAVVSARIFTLRGEGPERTVVWGEWGFLDPAFRGRLLLERALLHGVVRERLRSPFRPVYFVTEAATWKGYVALARAQTHFWPTPGCPLPDPERRMVARVLEQHGDPEWNAERGVFHRRKAVRFEGGQGHVPEGARALREHYLQVNPGHAEGDTLLCVARVTWASLLMMPIRTLVAQVSGKKIRRLNTRGPGSPSVAARRPPPRGPRSTRSRARRRCARAP